ncbi:hypothetical protein MtrunA17_Chr5g0397401 [Medicago truncatula]|uniref:DUF3527 domain protein n=1 Tax=Medicago truncatula TaxID=3880 RepID=A0A072UCU8_MEDTR|nr:uncharacterized protein LOC25494518 [Medicago truncatula]KEH27432.1 DUF3527 domain protein [Medicago truncatula]RHN53581.1 hypothetical protein MtrunA17_Chr5g0397401 [Medicago truncatula]
MGQELDLNDKSTVILSPNSVLPSHQNCLNVKKEKSCRSHRLEENIETRRGSIYLSPNQKKMATIQERKKIEISSRTSDNSYSGSIFYALCSGSDDEDSVEVETPSSVISQDSQLSSQSPSVSCSCTCMDHNISSSFIEFCINSGVCDKKSSVVEVVGSVNSKIRSNKVNDSLVIGNNSPLQKVKITHSHQPYPSESDCSSRVSSKVPFTPIRKRLNPFTKSKKVARNMACQKSLLNDFSNTTKGADIVSEFVNREIKDSGLACSHVHLHGNLKMKNKQGLPYFEFKVNSPEDVFVAKTWRVGNALNWVYTFHSFHTRTKSNAGLGSQHCDKDSSSMVAQMLVSCSLCSELEDGVIGNYMVTEFVLYDFTHSRKSVIPKKKSYSKQDASKTLNASSLESAAIVLRIPFHKRESLKYKRGDRMKTKAHSKQSDVSSPVEQVKVVLPIGNHGLPSAESEGPSSLLDRWKHGGGCDCGGWDMACPLILLGNPSVQFHEDRPLVEKYQPLELFSQPQGTKEINPTFSMTLVEEGQYAVDFHAKLSSLQAFSICVAILHGTSTFSAKAEQAKNQPLSQCSSLNTLIEEVELFIKSVIAEEKRKMSNIHKGIHRPSMLNQPFSPIGRV